MPSLTVSHIPRPVLHLQTLGPTLPHFPGPHAEGHCEFCHWCPSVHRRQNEVAMRFRLRPVHLETLAGTRSSIALIIDFFSLIPFGGH